MKSFAFDFARPVLGAATALVLLLSPVARADVDYWRGKLGAARDAGFVRVLEFRAQAPLNDRAGEFSADFVGPVADLGATGGAVAWQLGAFADDDGDKAGTFGLLYRFPPSASGAAGVNAFADYYNESDFGGFWRWSAGTEYRSSWVDVFANYYFPTGDEGTATFDVLDEDGEVIGMREVRSAVAEGYDAEVRIHSPELAWFSVVGGWSNWNGARFDRESRRGLRYGFRFSPASGWWENMRFSLLYDDARASGEKVGLDMSVYFVVGEGWEFARAGDVESARTHFRTASRERRVFLREN